MRIHHEKLRKRGWSQEEIDHAHRIVQEAHEQKHPAYWFLEVATFWGLLFLIVVGVVAVGVVLVPALIMLDTLTILLVIVLLGLCLGALFSILVQDIEWLERRHHYGTFVLLGVITIFPMWLIVAKMNLLTELYQVQHAHNPWLISGFFTGAILFPYLIHLARQELSGRWRKQHA